MRWRPVWTKLFVLLRTDEAEKSGQLTQTGASPQPDEACLGSPLIWGLRLSGLVSKIHEVRFGPAALVERGELVVQILDLGFDLGTNPVGIPVEL